MQILAYDVVRKFAHNILNANSYRWTLIKFSKIVQYCVKKYAFKNKLRQEIYLIDMQRWY